MANNLGDYDVSTVVYGKFVSCRADTGAPATLTSGALSVYKDNSTTESTAGVTFSGDFDSRTGLNHFTIDTSADGTFYAVGSFFDIVVTTGTVNSVSAVGSCVGQFTIRKTADLKPTTAGRALDVSAGGEAGVDWANVGSPTTTLALTGTTIAVTQKVDVDTIKTNPVVNGGTITFPTTATLASTTNITAGTVTTATNVTTVNGLAANVITATSINADAITAAKIADNAIDRATFAADTGIQSIRSNTAAAGGATSITLDASASAVDSFYKGDRIVVTGGTGVGQARVCTAYVGSTQVATVTPAWATNPDNTSTFAIVSAASDLVAIAGAAVSTSTAQLGVNVVNNAGSAITSASGIQEVKVASIAANAITATSIAADAITAAKVADGTIDAATFAAGAIDATAIASNAIAATKIASGAITNAKFAAGAIDAAAIADAAIDRATFAADTGLQPIRSNTATAGSGTTITLDASASAVDSFYINDIILLTGGTGVGQARFISAYVGATKVATVATWATNPDNTTTFAILPFDAVAGASAPTAAQVATAVWQDTTSGDFTTAGSIGKSLFTSGAVPGAAGGHFIAGTNATTSVTTAFTATFTGNLTGSVGSVASGGIAAASFAAGAIDATAIASNAIAATKIATGAITNAKFAAGAIDAAAIADGAIDAATFAAGAIDATAIADGAIDAATLASNTITAAKIATDAITSAQLAASAVTEIQSGLSTLDAAGIRTAVGLASANLDTQLSTIDDFLDTEIAAIKAKTDSLTFTAAAKLDVNVLALNGDATSAANIAKTTRAIARGTVGSASTTTSIVTSAFAPAGAVADQFKGRVCTFDADTTTAALRGQSTDITASSNASTPVLTVTALTTAPASTDSFSVT